MNRQIQNNGKYVKQNKLKQPPLVVIGSRDCQVNMKGTQLLEANFSHV